MRIFRINLKLSVQLIIVCIVIFFILFSFRENISKKSEELPIQRISDSEVRSKLRKYRFDLESYFTIAEKDIFKYLVLYNNSNNSEKSPCSIDIVKGAPSVPHFPHYNMKALDWPVFSTSFAKLLQISPGGEWQPDDCVSQFLVAIIIPIQNRESNLREFLLHIHPFLQRQRIHYRIYAIELPSSYTFNRGLTLNAGFIEAIKDKPFPCVILHDVDMLPKHGNNIYACTSGVRFMAVSRGPPLCKASYALRSVLAIQSDHFKLVNGFSNRFFNWGAEDVDFSNRIIRWKLPIMRFEPEISSFHSLPHKRAKRGDKNERDRLFVEGLFQSYEGLNTTKYNLNSRVNEPLCTRIIISY